jgi:hypothetical protein
MCEKERESLMKAAKRGLRMAPRKATHPVNVSYISSLDDFTKIARNCEIIEASSTGLLLQVSRKDLIPANLRQNLTLDILKGESIFMHLKDMDLEIAGIITRTQFMGKNGFLIAIDYTEDAPEYWRNCLMDLLPRPGELD